MKQIEQEWTLSYGTPAKSRKKNFKFMEVYDLGDIFQLFEEKIFAWILDSGLKLDIIIRVELSLRAELRPISFLSVFKRNIFPSTWISIEHWDF